MSDLKKRQTSKAEYILIAVLCSILVGLIIAGICIYMPRNDNSKETEFTPTVNTTGIPSETSGTDESSAVDETQSGVVTSIEEITTGISENTTGVGDLTSDESPVVSSEYADTTAEGVVTYETTGDISSQPVEISTKPEETSSPEQTTAKPVVTTKTPTVTTKSPVVTTKKNDETSAPLETVNIPSELTQNGQVLNDVLIAPNGDLVTGHWTYNYGIVNFIVDLPNIGLYEEYRWWHYNEYYNILEFGTYICTSTKLHLFSFVADEPLVTTRSEGSVVTLEPPVSVESGSWW